MNNQRYIVLAFLAFAAVLGAAVHGIAVPLVARFNLSDPEILPGVANATSVISMVLSVAIFSWARRMSASGHSLPTDPAPMPKRCLLLVQ